MATSSRQVSWLLHTHDTLWSIPSKLMVDKNQHLNERQARLLRTYQMWARTESKTEPIALYCMASIVPGVRFIIIFPHEHAAIFPRHECVLWSRCYSRLTSMQQIYYLIPITLVFHSVRSLVVTLSKFNTLSKTDIKHYSSELKLKSKKWWPMTNTAQSDTNS